MKKIIIASILSLAINTAFAQFDWGVKIGGGSANLGGGSNTGFDLSFGAFAKVELKDRFGIQFDALYSIKGASQDVDVLDSLTFETKKSSRTYKFTYVEIPIQVYFPFSEHLHLLVGLNFASVSSGQYQDEGSSKWVDIPGIEASMGIVGGLKYETATGWDFNFRYMTADGVDLSGKASTLQFTIGKFINW